MVASIIAYSLSRSSANALKRLSQTPFFGQRENRCCPSLCGRPFRIGRARPFIVAFGVTESRGCHRSEAQTAQGKLYLFLAIDRTLKFAVARLVDKANTQTARAFLKALCRRRALQGRDQAPPTTAFNSPTCQRTDQVRPSGSADTFRPRLGGTRNRTSADRQVFSCRI
jgi:hypothetical protein